MELESKETFHKRPLFHWIKSFAGRELSQEYSLLQLLCSNALPAALEFIGITPDTEQSSLHLSAIFDEDGSQQSKYSRYPSHYESETRSRIQNLNRMFLELQSYFEDQYSQLVAIKPPNSVHIATACDQCSSKEFEKLLYLLLGASIQGSRKQDTIRNIKKLPSDVQEALIENIKLVSDSPEIMHLKSWSEFCELSDESKEKTYSQLVKLVRRLNGERNECFQNLLTSDYFCGYTNCSQKRFYEEKSIDFERYSDDIRFCSTLRQLREEVSEKSELLQECREELETAQNRIHDLESRLYDTHQKLRSCRKARDELDALREGQEKASRLDAEVQRLKAKLRESEILHKKIDFLESENRTLKTKQDMLMDQISFLTIERPYRNSSFDFDSFEDSLFFEKDWKLDSEDIDDTGDSSRETLKCEEFSSGISFDKNDNEESSIEPPCAKTSAYLCGSESEAKANLVQDAGGLDLTSEKPMELEISKIEEKDTTNSGKNALVEEEQIAVTTSVPKEKEIPVVHKNGPVTSTPLRKSKRGKRVSLVNVKRRKPTVFYPVKGNRSSHKTKQTTPAVPVEITQEPSCPSQLEKDESSPSKFNELSDVEKISPSKSKILRTKKHNLKELECDSIDLSASPSPVEKILQIVEEPPPPSTTCQLQIDLGNDADEELSLSPSGTRQNGDLEPINNEQLSPPPIIQDDNDNDVFFVCATPSTPRSQLGVINKSSPPSPPNISEDSVKFTSSVLRPSIHHTVHMATENGFKSSHITQLKLRTYDAQGDQSSSNSTTGSHDDEETMMGEKIKESSTTSVPLFKFSNGISLAHSDSEGSHNDETGFSDCNIHLSLRSRGVKPATAFINKLPTNLNNNNNGSGGNLRYTKSPTQGVFSSSEDDSVWYEYGCV